MSKGLEALRKLDYEARYANTDDEGYSIKPYKATNFCEEEFNIIEKELKALEIIKTKRIDVNMLIIYETYLDWLDYYGQDLPQNMWLTQEEFDLLKEMLEEC